ncbi:tRNA (guanine46-N7-)-methyltransferase [hydrothermal vent metagenome]|uniref:tRNA (guanine(46)-N(7))-methyltransferase n=1 Tax=hydrothermal vent metagenome TaxID=652676 RepID=A0A1W1D321_9ZZZZ
MPHLHIEEFKTIDFPITTDDNITFHFMVTNVTNKNENLIAVSVEEDTFFLVTKKEQNKNLLKTDKLTRPASIYNVHKALLAYAHYANIKILSSNVPQYTRKNIHLQEVTALKKIDYFASHFPTDKEVYIEVGFGSGRHILHQAANNPDILFIGIEIHRPSIEQVLKQINIQKLDNLLLLDYDARLFMELVPSNIVGKIFVHFPVPWDKKPHRRVISTSFIQEARRVLKVDGRLELRTDSENYYAYSYETFISFHKTTLHIHKNKDIAVSSKYEDRWKRMEKNIYDIIMINEENSPALTIEGDFHFSSPTLSFDELISLQGVTKKFEDGFVHFERVYTSNDKIVFRISMGSFNRPEHLYVILEKEKTYYYPSTPLKSKSNYKAHQYLNRIFHG